MTLSSLAKCCRVPPTAKDCDVLKMSGGQAVVSMLCPHQSSFHTLYHCVHTLALAASLVMPAGGRWAFDDGCYAVHTKRMNSPDCAAGRLMLHWDNTDICVCKYMMCNVMVMCAECVLFYPVRQQGPHG
jgi:hypothetical protein